MQIISVRAGSAQALEQAPESIADDEFLWFDCHYEHVHDWVEPVGRLTGAVVLEEHLRDAQNRGHPSYFDSTSDYEMIVFRGLALGGHPPSTQAPIRVRTRPTVFFVFARCIVTVRAPDSRIIAALRERLLAASGARQRLPASPAELMIRVLHAMIDRYLELRQPMTEQLERWQRLLLDPRRPFRDWFALLEARAELRKLEELCEEQLDALQGWRDARAERESSPDSAGLGPLSDALQVRARDIAEHIQRVLSHARRLQVSVETAVQLHFGSTAHRTNEIVRTLTTITAIFLPLTLITGIFGMNFEFIPGLHARNGFWIAVGVMVLIALALVAYFRARRFIADPGARVRRRPHRPGAGGSADAGAGANADADAGADSAAERVPHREA